MTKRLIVVTSLHRADDHRIYHKQILSLKGEYDITLICPKDKLPPGFKPEVKIIPIDGGEGKLSRLFFIYRILKLLRKERNSLILFHDFELIFAAVFLRILENGNEILYDMHEDYPSQILLSRKIPDAFKPSFYIFLMLSEMLLLPLFDHLFTADDFLKRKYYSIMKGKITSVFNFPEFRRVEIKRIQKERLSLVYCGGLYFERGLYELSVLAEMLPECDIHLFGRTFTDEENDFLKKSIASHKNIIFHGYKPYDELLQILPAMDFGLVLMKANKKFRRNISVKQFDYMLSGVPVIIRKGLVSFVEDGITGYNVSSVEEAAEKIKNVGYEEIDIMRKKASEKIEKELNWKKESMKMKESLRKIVSLKGASECQEYRQDPQKRHR
ncbi:MAG: hypothetical protein AB7T10_01870 [bacterium]